MNDQAPFYTSLKRGLLNITGTDRHQFLQNIITNDLNLLKTQGSLYACLLTPQGKFLHDFFITEENNALFVDCEPGTRTEDLAKRLKMYALRADIKIDADPENETFLTIGHAHGHSDPRHISLGYRARSKPKNIKNVVFDIWDTIRIINAVPDGSRDMIPEKSTLMESRIDKLNGISFHKGCYVGQELTARMYYRGLAKKHLHAICAEQWELEKLPEFGETLILNDRKAGEMRSKNATGTHGIALLKNDVIVDRD